MKQILEYLSFKRFVMPFALQILFWAAIGGTLYGSWWLFVHGNWAWIMSLTFGVLGCRLIFESLMIRYQTYQCLNEIRNKLYEDEQV